ncbi:MULTISPECIES: hypothetical protein [unclassified Streptomyces]|uniref:hypothetical protein n=1 Tax=Streptomyces sp. NPDC087538 TaxID=3365797 RepID=UPI002F912A50
MPWSAGRITTAGVAWGEQLVEWQPGCLDEATLSFVMWRACGAGPIRAWRRLSRVRLDRRRCQ